MKNRFSIQKASRDTDHTSVKDASAGPNGIAMASPSYGIDFVDEKDRLNDKSNPSLSYKLDLQKKWGIVIPQSKQTLQPKIISNTLQNAFSIQPMVQMVNSNLKSDEISSQIHQTAKSGVQGVGQKLPHFEQIQKSFGKHNISHVQSYTDSKASVANRAMGAEAYTTGNKIAFASTSPSLYTTAHEAAHVIQQQTGVQLQNGIGKVNDKYEHHADAVADAVIQGRSSETILDKFTITDTSKTIVYPTTFQQQYVKEDTIQTARDPLPKTQAHPVKFQDANTSIVQYKVSWNETSVKNKNLINTVVNNADFGFTEILVNGVATQRHNPRHLLTPILNYEKRGNQDYTVDVKSEAQNNLGTRMDLPTNPPWTGQVDKSRVGNILYFTAKTLNKDKGASVLSYVKGKGQTNLIVKGTPSDAALARLTKDHEQHHVDEFKAVKEEIVDPWDAKIAKKKENGTKTAGVSAQSAERLFFAEVGGTGAEIGQQFIEQCAQKGIAFHRTQEGGKPTITAIDTVKDQSSITVTYKHPVDAGMMAGVLGKWWG